MTRSIDSNLYPTAWNVLFQATWNYIPESILKRVHYLPTREYTRFRHALRVTNQVAKRLIGEKSATVHADDKSNKDIMSVLGTPFCTFPALKMAE